MAEKNTVIRNKTDLDAYVARETGFRRKVISEVTASFLRALVDALSDMERVQLDGVGHLHVVEEGAPAHPVVLSQTTGKKRRTRSLRVTRKFRVWFSKSPVFNRILRDKHGACTE